MIQKRGISILKGCKNTLHSENKIKIQNKRKSQEQFEKIKKCLNCTKPIKECKGDCF